MIFTQASFFTGPPNKPLCLFYERTSFYMVTVPSFCTIADEMKYEITISLDQPLTW